MAISVHRNAINVLPAEKLPLVFVVLCSPTAEAIPQYQPKRTFHSDAHGVLQAWLARKPNSSSYVCIFH